MIINDYFTLIVHNEIEYKVTIQNLHIRVNQEALLKNIIDEMPSNMSIVNGSLRSNYYEVLAGVSTELALPSALANPNMSVDGQKDQCEVK